MSLKLKGGATGITGIVVIVEKGVQIRDMKLPTVKRISIKGEIRSIRESYLVVAGDFLRRFAVEPAER